MNLRSSLCVVGVLSLASPAAAQPVFKCEDKGTIIYTDQPCAPGARAAPLPDVIVVRPPSQSQRELARAHDDRLARDRADRDRGDAGWLQEHARRQDRDERVRKAIIEHRVIKGMTMDEVRQALGEPERVQAAENYGTAKETWTYLANGQARTVNFKDREVISTAVKRKTRK
jgi:hypothetical protein